MASTESKSSYLPLFIAARVIFCAVIISGSRERFSSFISIIYTLLQSNSPFLLHRPAACAALSRPARERTTHLNDKSTPASISWVVTQITLDFEFFDFNNTSILSITLRLCSGHIPVLRWSITAGFSEHSSASLSFRKISLAAAFVFTTTKRLSVCLYLS